MAVFVLDKHKKPLMPCSEKRARLLLERGRAVVHRMAPFTIRLKDRTREDSVLQPVRLCIKPGSKTTGMALVREEEQCDPDAGKECRRRVVLSLFELHHRGEQIHRKLLQRSNYRRARRSRNLRHRAPRFNNRRRRDGWLPPSLQHRVDTTLSWAKRLKKLAPVVSISMELARFDTQKLQNPEISGVEYQHGELWGYEVREYLLEKWGRKCAYCGAKDKPLEIDHIASKSRGGTDRVSNLTLACHACNQAKGNSDVREFLANQPKCLGKILARAKAPLKDAAAVNSTRWALYNGLIALDNNLETGTGGRTRWNRTRQGIPKNHALDAVCVGRVDSVQNWQIPVLAIRCTGRGSYQRTRLGRYGFPRGYLMRQKQVLGFQTGDMVRAEVPRGKKAGVYTGCVAVRASGSFNIQTSQGTIQGIHARYCRLLQRADGYGYFLQKQSTEPRILPAVNDGVSGACLGGVMNFDMNFDMIENFVCFLPEYQESREGFLAILMMRRKWLISKHPEREEEWRSMISGKENAIARTVLRGDREKMARDLKLLCFNLMPEVGRRYGRLPMPVAEMYQKYPEAFSLLVTFEPRDLLRASQKFAVGLARDFIEGNVDEHLVRNVDKEWIRYVHKSRRVKENGPRFVLLDFDVEQHEINFSTVEDYLRHLNVWPQVKYMCTTPDGGVHAVLEINASVGEGILRRQKEIISHAKELGCKEIEIKTGQCLTHVPGINPNVYYRKEVIVT